MACYKPILGYSRIGGGVTFERSESNGREIQLPCGRCIGCRSSRSKEWAIRCMHEASQHENNCFITLTYDEDHIPKDHGLHHSDFQKFMKRLRKAYRNLPIRYYMAGEYGKDEHGGLGRPHFHAIMFGIDFSDKYLLYQENGRNYYRSETLETIWPNGMSNITGVTFQTAAYVARYIMKKVTGEKAEDHYQKVDPYTGEIYKVNPEYNCMSLKPGIASEWFEKFRDDVFPHDYVIWDGKKIRTPKYYLDKLAQAVPGQFDEVKEARKKTAIDRKYDNTPERLAVREQVCKMNLSRTKRNLQ